MEACYTVSLTLASNSWVVVVLDYVLDVPDQHRDPRNALGDALEINALPTTIFDHGHDSRGRRGR